MIIIFKIFCIKRFLVALIVTTVGYLLPTVSQASSIDMQLGLVEAARDSRQSAVLILGDTRFAIVKADYPTGDVSVRMFDVKTGFKGAKSTIIKNETGYDIYRNDASVWVASSMDQGLKYQCQDLVSKNLSWTHNNKREFNIGRTNMFVSAMNGKVYLTQLISCPRQALQVKTVVVGQGFQPGLAGRAALAIGTTDEGQRRIFVAWRDKDNKISGRFYSTNLDVIGTKVLIAHVGGTLTLDMIWNPISKRFITGFRDTAGFGDCKYLNASTFMSGVSVPAVIRFVDCDNDRGGHLSWVDIDKNTERNPSGNYPWWTSAESLPNLPEDTRPSERHKYMKKIHIMDKFGVFTGNDVQHLGGSASVGDTQVFTEVINSEFKPLDQIAKHLNHEGRYMDHYIGDFHSQNGGLATFSNAIAKTKVETKRVQAIGALKNHTVIVSLGEAGSSAILFLSVIKNQNSSLLVKP